MLLEAGKASEARLLVMICGSFKKARALLIPLLPPVFERLMCSPFLKVVVAVVARASWSELEFPPID